MRWFSGATHRIDRDLLIGAETGADARRVGRSAPRARAAASPVAAVSLYRGHFRACRRGGTRPKLTHLRARLSIRGAPAGR